MNCSIRHCAFAISALLVSVSAIDLNTPAQARPLRQRNKPVTMMDISPEAAAAGIKAANDFSLSNVSPEAAAAGIKAANEIESRKNKPVITMPIPQHIMEAAAKRANEIESRKNKPVITMPIPQHIMEAAAKRAAQRKAAQGSISQQYDYLGAWNQANSAISLCYEHKNFRACNELTQIKNTLMSWCSQNDRNSCTVYKNVISAEGIAQSLRVAEEATR